MNREYQTQFRTPESPSSPTPEAQTPPFTRRLTSEQQLGNAVPRAVLEVINKAFCSERRPLSRPALPLISSGPASAEMELLALQLTDDADAIDVVLGIVVAIAAETAVAANRWLLAVHIAVAITCNPRCGYH